MLSKNIPVCVIEDNLPIRKLFCTILKKSEFETVDFADGQSGITWLENNTPLAVIVDILLPDMNGTELLNCIRKLSNGSKIPVIAVTGFAQSNDKEKFIELGFDHYIAKPINTSTFASEVSEIISAKLN